MLRGKLFGKNLGDSVELTFMQRGDKNENKNVPVRIYRRNAPEIPFSNDLSGMPFNVWYEYVDNQKHTDSRVEIIFEGTLPIEMSFNHFIDTDVIVGEKYIYWVEADSFNTHTILGPIGIKVRNRDIWWPFEYWRREMDILCKESPAPAKIITHGETSMHRPIDAMHIGNQERTVALLGSVHASETGPELLLKALRTMFSSNPSIFSQVGVALLPAINIDVREQTIEGVPHYLRLNHNGVDLNRNFDFNWGEQSVYGLSSGFLGSVTYRGPYPNSENETRAVIRFLEHCDPIAVFVFDSGSVITEDKMFYDAIEEGTYLFNEATKIATTYSAVFRYPHEDCGTFTAPPISFPVEDPVFKESGMPTGTLDGWASTRFQVPAFSIHYAGSDEGSLRINDDTTLDLLDMWSRRHAHAILAVMEMLSQD